MTDETQTTQTNKERNAKTSQAEVFKFARLMIAGMTAHSEELTKRGVDATYVSGIQTELTASETLDAEQETLKAAAKTKTTEFNARFAELQKALGEAKKLVKMTIPQEGWVEFGITDKR